MSRVDVLFVHDLNATQKRRLFVKITSIKAETFVRDEFLNLSILMLASLAEDHVFVDLSNIHAKKLYMILINNFAFAAETSVFAAETSLDSLRLEDFSSREMI